jgi:stage III sporulation protein AH
VGEAVLTSGSVTLSEAKINREQTRAKAKEMLLEIINNENLTEDSKQEAINKMLALTENMEKENAAETQLEAKGFADAVVSISDDSVDVTVNATSLTDQQRTQIEDIVMRKTGCELTQVVITTMAEQ